MVRIHCSVSFVRILIFYLLQAIISYIYYSCLVSLKCNNFSGMIIFMWVRFSLLERLRFGSVIFIMLNNFLMSIFIQRSKDQCCEKHFWWCIAQYIENEHPMWSSSGMSCTNLHQWDVKYTPQSWDTSDLIETLQECCNVKFWWDVKGRNAWSPRELM